MCQILYSSWPHGSSDNVRKNGQFQLKTITSKSSLERKIYLYLLQMVNDNGLNIYGTGPYRHKFKVLIIKEYLSGTQNFFYFKTDVQFFVHCSLIFWVKNILSHQMLQRNKQNKLDIKIIYLPNFGKTWNLGHWTHCWHQIESDTKYCTNITRVAPGSHSKSLPYTIHTNQFP